MKLKIDLAKVGLVWDVKDVNVDKWFAVLSSTSAPTYFDVEELDGTWYADGGMWANSPIAVLNAGLKRAGFHDNCRIITFDTDMDMMVQVKGNQTLLRWGSYVLDEWVARSGKSGDYQVMADIGRENVHVLSPSTNGKKYTLDDVADSKLDELVKIWRGYYKVHEEEIISFLENT